MVSCEIRGGLNGASQSPESRSSSLIYDKMFSIQIYTVTHNQNDNIGSSIYVKRVAIILTSKSAHLYVYMIYDFNF